MPRRASTARVLFSLSLLALPPSVRSQHQQLEVQRFSLDRGAPTSVTCIAQDHTGFLWIGTWNGLYRHDGYSFVAYNHQPEDSSSLSHSRVTALYVDAGGALWIGTPAGLDRLDQAAGSFTHFLPNPSAPPTDPGNSVWYISEDRNQNLWVATGQGLCTLNKARTSFTYPEEDPTGFWGAFIQDIYRDEEGTVWFGTARGLARYDARRGVPELVWWDTTSNRDGGRDTSLVRFTGMPTYWVNAICRDDKGILWLATGGGVVEYDCEQNTYAVHRIAAPDPGSPHTIEDPVTSICRDPATGDFFVGASTGLFRFDRSTRTFTRLIDTGIMCVFSERSGTIWFGTNAELLKINRTRVPFTKYDLGDVACGLEMNDDGRIWVFAFARSGWIQFDPMEGRAVPYSLGPDHLLYVYREGDLAFLKRDGSFYIRDALGVVRVLLGPEWKAFNYTLSFGWKTRKGYYVGRHDGGLYLLTPGTERPKEIVNLGQSIYFITEDSSEFLWVALRLGGLFRYDHRTQTLENYGSEARPPPGRIASEVNQIYQDSKGILWFATATGLARYERAADSFTRFTEREGLPGDNVRGILEDTRGALWLNTTRGIARLDPGTGAIRAYDDSYGLDPAAGVFYGWGCKSRNGEMYFGSANGITRFHPDSVRDNPYVTPVVITALRGFDRPYPLSDRIELRHDENYLSFEFAALSYVSPERNQYAYRMEGIDKGWIDAGTRRYASYQNLAPGEYVFRVKGSNNEGVWNEAGASVAILITPPWWKTTWAYALYAGVIFAAGFSAWKTQLRRIRTRHEFQMARFEAEKLHELDALKTRFFADISHEFRTPLTLILGPVRQMLDAADDDHARNQLRMVQRNARRLLTLVNQLLDLSRLESGSMKLQAAPRNIVSLVRGLCGAFCSHAERKRITLTIASAADVIEVYVDRDKFEKIVSNLLSNAFRFTPEGGSIEVSVEEESNGVLVRVRDTGIGIPADEIPMIFDRFYQVNRAHSAEREGSGIGLSLTRELVELHKGTIHVESEEGRGTTFTVRLPKGTAHLKPEEICELQEEVGEAVPHPESASLDAEDGPRYSVTGAHSATGRRSILVVDDNADVRAYIRGILSEPYSVLEAADGEEGWTMALENTPDIIVSDIMMPALDGYALCRRLKADERTSHIPVILLTARASTQDKIEGFDVGADDYIMKPFEPSELESRLRNLAAQRQRLQEHFRKHGLIELHREQITAVDQRFLQTMMSIIAEHLADESFGVERLAQLMAVSPSSLLKKVEALTGEPPNAVIRRTRLSKAARLLEGKFGNISEVALEVGFSNPSYFTECFRHQFGVTPSEYRRTEK